MFLRFAALLGLALCALAHPAAADCRSACLARHGCSLDDAAGRPGSGLCAVVRPQCAARCSSGSSHSPGSGPAYGAIARGAGGLGFAWNYRTRALAEGAAVQACVRDGGANCKPVLYYFDQCAAVAVSRSDIAGWDRGETAGEARDNAIAQCRLAKGEDCHVKPEHLKCSG